MERSLFKLSREGYDDSYRELFLLGNGHLGYEGSLPDEDGGFHLVGVYDQCGDKWRESLNLFDPFRLRVRFDGRDLAFSKARLSWNLDYRRAVLRLRAEWKEGVYFEERFLSSSVDTLLFAKSRFRAKKTGRLSLRFQIEKDPHDINGPHYASFAASSSPLSLEGTSNEGRKAKVSLKIAGLQGLKASVSEGTPLADWEGEVKKGEIVFFERAAEALVDDERPMEGFISYEDGYWDHVSERKRRFGFFFPKADGESPFLEGLYDSAYRMSVLSDYSRIASIPARGVSGQVYKGAAFWDSEMFMLPYFLLLEPEEARSLLLYRIKTLPGALKKAERFGYQGAFYAWESQEDGVERCSLYNVTDRKTGKGIRTYFADKAIHISADIVKAFSSYYRSTGDSSLFSQGAVDVIAEVFRFYRSYASEMEDGLFHFLDVVGPDEYHERVDDNAFTNYQIAFAFEDALSDLKAAGLSIDGAFSARGISEREIRDFLSRIYLPKPDERGIIEQFSGFYEREDILPKELAKRLEDPDDYWGKYAAPTRVNKQADVVALLAIYPERFPFEALKANYEFYLPYTEHGSSLSHVMFGILAALIGKEEEAYGHYLSSARIDLVGGGKRFAGGIKIAGSHPASLSGSFLILFNGFLGARMEGERIAFFPRLPKEIASIRVNYYAKGKRHRASFERK